MHVDFESMISECGLEIGLTKKLGSGHRTLFICGNPHSNETDGARLRGVCDQGAKRPFKSDTPFGQAMTQFLLPLLVGVYASFTIVAMALTTILGA